MAVLILTAASCNLEWICTTHILSVINFPLECVVNGTHPQGVIAIAHIFLVTREKLLVLDLLLCVNNKNLLDFLLEHIYSINMITLTCFVFENQCHLVISFVLTCLKWNCIERSKGFGSDELQGNYPGIWEYQRLREVFSLPVGYVSPKCMAPFTRESLSCGVELRSSPGTLPWLAISHCCSIQNQKEANGPKTKL